MVVSEINTSCSRVKNANILPILQRKYVHHILFFQPSQYCIIFAFQVCLQKEVRPEDYCKKEMSFLERAVRKENSLSHLCPKTTHVLISVNYATFGAKTLKGSGWPLLNHSIPVAFPCYSLT